MIQKAAVVHFQNNFGEARKVRPTLGGQFQRHLPGDVSLQLERPFEEGEIVAALKGCNSLKAPGPDSFNFSFIKKGWEFMKDIITQFFSKFHRNGKLTKGINSTFVALIPKIDCPTTFKDFRPISKVGSIYKILSKVLANMLKESLSTIIGEAQAAFVGGKQILDGFLIANEAIHSWKHSVQGGLILKLDFEKAYDCVNWGFLLYMLKKAGFGDKWCGWIRECCSTVSMSVLINGSATQEFQTQKGLRQGDPLSPFLFNVVAEALNILLERAQEKNIIKSVKLGSNGVTISHLLFADDTILFCNNDLEEMGNIKRILRCFQLMSGLKINYSKSSVCGVKIQREDVQALAQVMGCRVESLPIKYLGLPLGANPRRIKTWEPVLERTQKRLSIWRTRTISTGGRLTLINHNSSTLPIYFMSLFKMPVAVAKMLEKLQRQFFWGDTPDKKKMHLVHWERITVKVVRGKYNLDRRSWLPYTPLSGSISNIWKDICSVGENDSVLGFSIREGFKVQVNSGCDTLFWEHMWLGNTAIKDEFPRLYGRSTQQNEVLSNICGGGSQGDWNLLFRGSLRVREHHQFEELKQRLNGVTLDPSKSDLMQWNWTANKIFSVKSVYQRWEMQLQSRHTTLGSVWRNLSPPKVEIFSWMAIQNRIATRSILLDRNLIPEVHLATCPLCALHVETPQHLLLHCRFSWVVWSEILNWWHIQWVCPASLEELASWWFGNRFRNLEKNIWEVCFFATLWSIWLTRNGYIFNGITTEALEVADLIKTKVAMWMKAKFDIKLYTVEDFKGYLDGIRKVKM
ncbi:uncharacterized protein LOC131327580 [Rhododendron vialii]|uniref:uncharacterized protein LOC131327580 n=1 Tax=Rhododendron vialii TaxID=182163 RepID=UPI00265DE67C|nr:uncharacterized protein LOC131327580 [Rhododendron vialii]